MYLNARILLLVATALLCGPVSAQIFTCTAADGTKVFSDKRCGPDAKLVKGVTTTPKKTTASAAVKTPPKAPKELEGLLEQCNDGDEAACMTWSKAGGPAHLRTQEKTQETSCEAGSITACEQRYCRDGATDQCRKHVVPLATVSGETWYLRFQQKQSADAPAIYSIRCMREGSRVMRDITVSCAAAAGPNRCQAEQSPQGFERLDQAATMSCGVKQQ